MTFVVGDHGLCSIEHKTIQPESLVALEQGSPVTAVCGLPQLQSLPECYPLGLLAILQLSVSESSRQSMSESSPCCRQYQAKVNRLGHLGPLRGARGRAAGRQLHSGTPRAERTPRPPPQASL